MPKVLVLLLLLLLLLLSDETILVENFFSLEIRLFPPGEALFVKRRRVRDELLLLLVLEIFFCNFFQGQFERVQKVCLPYAKEQQRRKSKSEKER
jgi:hypothetical protein